MSSALARVAAAEPAPTVLAYLLDGDSENLVRGCFADIGMIDWQVVRGGIDRAIEELAGRAAPRLVIIDVSGLADPVLQLRRLAEKSEAGFEVIVVGDRNDIVLYRDLKSIGVAEYFFKPLAVPMINRALGAILDGRPAYAAARTGKLITVLGARGGVGATTVATNLAWHIAAGHERSVVLLDLDLQGGDCALQLDAEPSPALREALDHPDRIDDVFIEHAVRHITPRLHLLASLEELGRRLMPREDAVMQLLQRLQANYRYVLVDLPLVEALRFPRLLELPGTVLLVGTGTASCAREVARWRERLGPNTAERSLLHILNKRGSKASLREDQLSQVIGRPADLAIPFSPAVALADRIGTRAVQKLSVIRRSMSAISWQVAGRVSEPPLPRWRWIFARPRKRLGDG
ncbi:MAG TPA: AAA family ATPase [Stellaceae bacterium]|nr:AAA family ATPase [Stellaceae bacterium]